MTKKEWDEGVDKDKSELRILIDQLRMMPPGKTYETIAMEIFDIGFKEGQRFVWFQRGGFGKYNDEETTYTITTNN